jgi:hypothetical protein
MFDFLPLLNQFFGERRTRAPKAFEIFLHLCAVSSKGYFDLLCS